jgi:hypothetical protein
MQGWSQAKEWNLICKNQTKKAKRAGDMTQMV